jgi:hypothetical protein
MSDYLNASKQIWFFSQLGKFPKYIDPLTKKNGMGFCAGMVVCWLLLRRSGADFFVQDNGERGRTIQPTREQGDLIQSYQLRHIMNAKRKGYEEMLNAEILKALDVNAVVDATDTDGNILGTHFETADIKMVVDYVSAQMTRREPCLVGGELTGFFIVRFRAYGKSGHVCAIEVKGAVIGKQVFRWMDPNEGCWLFDSLDDFRAWFLWRYTSDSLIGQAYDKRVKVHQVIFPTASGYDTAAISFHSTVAAFTNKIGSWGL